MVQLESASMVDNFLRLGKKVESQDDAEVVSDNAASTVQICGYKAKISKVENEEEEKDFYNQVSSFSALVMCCRGPSLVLSIAGLQRLFRQL